MNPISNMQAGSSNNQHQLASQASAPAGSFSGAGVTHQQGAMSHLLSSDSINSKFTSRIKDYSIQNAEVFTAIRQHFETNPLDTGVVQSTPFEMMNDTMDFMTTFCTSKWKFTDLDYFNKATNPVVSLDTMSMFHLAETREKYGLDNLPFPSEIVIDEIRNKDTRELLSNVETSSKEVTIEAFLCNTTEGKALANLTNYLGINIDDIVVETELDLVEPLGSQSHHLVTCMTSPNQQIYGVQ